jgi:beta-phosphoglucomutase-like phosphatase (HAD superfamily)
VTGAAGRITHLFLDVNDVLIDRAKLSRYAERQLGRVMAGRFGGAAETWSAAYRRVQADWDDYYADLNLSGDDGLADLGEGAYRTTRALFRLTGTPEPEQPDLTALSRELPALAARGHDAFYPEVPDILHTLDDAGIVIGVVGHRTAAHLRAILEPVLSCFRGTIWGADNAEHFEKDAQRYLAAALRARAAPECCMVAESSPPALEQAARAGMRTLSIDRSRDPRALWALVEACLN